MRSTLIDRMAGTYKRRAAILLLLVVAIATVASLDVTYDAVSRVIQWADRVVVAHEIAGAVVFVLLSALSAMLAFFSTAVFVPVAIGAWGKLLTVILLWAGWMSGGSLAYFIGRYLGRRVVRWFMPDEKLRPYETRLTALVSFPRLLLFQFALPSEIPGYVMGLLAVPFHRYLGALAIAELPFAVGAVYLGDSFLQRNEFLMIALGVAGILVTLVAAMIFHRRFGEPSAVDHAPEPVHGDSR